MNTTIFYFSATGNSLKAARDVADKLGEASGETAFLSIPDVTDTRLPLSSDTVGIVFPVHMWGIPAIVARFVEGLKISKPGPYIFAIATYKSQPGGVMRLLRKKLNKHGLELSAGFTVSMPGNNIAFYETDTEEIASEKFENWGKRLEEIALRIRNHETGIIEQGAFLERAIGTGLLHGLLTRTLRNADKQFRVNGNCTGCGVCLRLCPVHNIELIDGNPVWLHKCEQCTACINLCPGQAIQFGKATTGRKRYRNPFVKPADLMKE